MIKYYKLIIVIAIISLPACGFKVSNNILFSEFYIESIETSNKKIDFLIKQSLKNKLSNENAIKQIRLNINNFKTRTINEKDVQNKITKYEISIETNLEVTFLENLEKQNIKVSSSGIYNVSSKHIETKRNQENLEKYLANKNVEQILKSLTNIKR